MSSAVCSGPELAAAVEELTNDLDARYGDGVGAGDGWFIERSYAGGWLLTVKSAGDRKTLVGSTMIGALEAAVGWRFLPLVPFRPDAIVTVLQPQKLGGNVWAVRATVEANTLSGPPPAGGSFEISRGKTRRGAVELAERVCAYQARRVAEWDAEWAVHPPARPHHQRVDGIFHRAGLARRRHPPRVGSSGQPRPRLERQPTGGRCSAGSLLPSSRTWTSPDQRRISYCTLAAASPNTWPAACSTKV